eukprot:5793224-Amphidinium_carterae.3
MATRPLAPPLTASPNKWLRSLLRAFPEALMRTRVQVANKDVSQRSDDALKIAPNPPSPAESQLPTWSRPSSAGHAASATVQEPACETLKPGAQITDDFARYTGRLLPHPQNRKV